MRVFAHANRPDKTRRERHLSVLQIQDVIAELNGTIQDVSNWKRVLQLMVKLFNGNQAYLNLVDKKTDRPVFVASSSDDEDFVREYWDAKETEDLWLSISKGMRELAVATDTDLIDDDELLSSSFYKEMLEPNNFRYVLNGTPLHTTEFRASLGILRPNSSGRFSSAEKEILSHLLPHFKTALLVYLELSRNALRIRGLSEGILSAFGFGVLLLNQDSDVLMQNDLASEILASQSTVKVVEKRVTARGNDRLVSALRNLKKSLAEGPSADTFFDIMTLRLGPGEGITVLRVVIGSIRLRMESHMLRDPRVPQAFVMLLNPEKVNQSVDHTYLKSRYALSRAEIRIAEAIVVGLSVSKMAEMFDVSAETIRTQLKAVYQKTGVNSQVALSRLIVDHAVVQLPLGVSQEAIDFDDPDTYEVIS